MTTVGQKYTFNYTGAVQNWTVPSDVLSIRIECYGAQGANAYNGSTGGKGGYVKGEFILNDIQNLYIYVGGQGNDVIGGWNGGGNGFSGSSGNGGGGGGATDVRLNQTDLNSRIIVGAGGGGGMGWYKAYGGGNGGGLTGDNGATPQSSFQGGTGGTQTYGGSGGYYNSGPQYGTPGGFGYGGNGVQSYLGSGGGGSGYYGGGGGGGTGGGGSSYYGFLQNSLTSTGVNSSNGLCIITVLSLRPILVTNVSLNKTSTVINIGKTEVLTATISPSTATNKSVTWVTSNSNIATVNNGVITAVSSGSCNITVTTQDGNFIASCTVIANASPIINDLTKTIINNQVQISATNITDANNDIIKYQVSINGTITNSTLLQSSPLSFNTLTFTQNKFNLGTNTITIIATDSNNFSSQQTIAVTKTYTTKLLIQDGLKWKYINNNNLITILDDYTSTTDIEKEYLFITYGMTNINMTDEVKKLLENNKYKIRMLQINILS